MNMKYRSMPGKSQGGFSLIEFMLVVALGALLYFGTVGNFGASDAQTQTDNEVRALTSLVPLIKQTFKSVQGNYDGLANEVMRRNNSFPKSMEDPASTSNIRHAWANDGIDLGVTGTSDEFFTITYKDVPGNACIPLVSRISDFFIDVEVDGTIVDGVADISTNCVGNDSTPEAPVDIVFRGR